jgi:transposase InsO family protein/transposase-like protein
MPAKEAEMEGQEQGNQQSRTGIDQAKDIPTPTTPQEDQSSIGGHRNFTTETKLQYLNGYEGSGMTIREYCQKLGIPFTLYYRWKKAYETQGKRGLKPKERGNNSKRYSPEEKFKAVMAWKKTGGTVEEFAKVWGISKSSLNEWIRRYDRNGNKGLERLRRGSRNTGIATGVKDAIKDVKGQFPSFGLEKVRDYLFRFRALKTSTASIRKTFREAKIGVGQTPLRKLRKREQPRLFERSTAGELWQSDITSFVMTRHSQRVYLVVFMDDYSRYIVSWGLHLQMRSEMVTEALLDGIGKFGKPKEVLTDQGPQYFTWRGKGEFQKVLNREGIKHVVARSHHPQTLGKTERFWSTVWLEFWSRIQPQELTEATERLGHFIAYYNHFRTHQSIEKMVPADRFFGVENQVREAIEKRLSKNELLMALEEEPRKPVFLVGQIGDQKVSLHGENGKLILHAQGAASQELTYQSKEGENDGRNRGQEPAGRQTEGQESQDQAQGHASAGQGIVGVSKPGGEGEGTPDGSAHAASVAGTDIEGRSSQEVGNPAVKAVAPEPASHSGDGSGTIETAKTERQGEQGDESGVVAGHQGFGEEGQGTGAGEHTPEGAH